MTRGVYRPDVAFTSSFAKDSKLLAALLRLHRGNRHGTTDGWAEQVWTRLRGSDAERAPTFQNEESGPKPAF